MADQLSFPGAGGPKRALLARPPGGRGPAVIVVVTPSEGGAAGLCAALARRGFLAASLAPSGASATEQERSALDVDDLGALCGSLLVQGGPAGRAVGLLAFGAGVGPATTMADSLPDAIGALVAFCDDDLGPRLLAVEVPVQAHLRADVADAAALTVRGGNEVIGHPSVPTADELADQDGGGSETLRMVADFLDEHLREPG